MKFHRLAGAAGVAGFSLALLSTHAWAVNTVNVTGTIVGSDGAPSNGVSVDFLFFNEGNAGSSGYTAPPPGDDGNTTYVVNANITGGKGGATTGNNASNNYAGGGGGDGLFVQDGSSVNPLVSVNGGTYTGGVGGDASGVGNQISGGRGGYGMEVINNTAVINGGVFTGGTNGTGTNSTALEFAGNGLEVHNSALNAETFATINGGTFQGGAASPGGVDGSGFVNGNGGVNIFGGTFTAGGPSGFGIAVDGGSVTLVGSNFEVDGVPTSGDVHGTGTITGTLQNNGSPTSITFDVQHANTFTLVEEIPEPTSTAILLGAAGLLGLGRKRRGVKRSARKFVI